MEFNWDNVVAAAKACTGHQELEDFPPMTLGPLADWFVGFIDNNSFIAQWAYLNSDYIEAAECVINTFLRLS